MFQQILERLALELGARGLPYMIVGGQAVLLYGEPRLTRDIDVTLGADIDRLPDVRAAARALGLRLLVDPETFVRDTMVLPCEEPASGIRVDFIFSHSPYERQALDRAKLKRIGSADLRFASLEDVVIQKIVAGRPRDIEDVKGMLLKNPAVDAAYVERWLREFEGALGEPFLERFAEVRRRAR